jgi:hypothetical protein
MWNTSDKQGCPLLSPTVEERKTLEPGKHVVTLSGLVRMKLMSYRDQDRLHIRDMIDVGLVDRELAATLPPELANRLDNLLSEFGR